MKRMIRILMIAICCMLSCNMAANAGNDKPIAVNALPIKAQTLLSNHFNNQKVILATIETGVINKSYDVVLQNGTKLEFDKKGNLTEIDCKQGKVPAKLIPQAIRNYLKENYPAQAVKKIEMNKNERKPQTQFCNCTGILCKTAGIKGSYNRDRCRTVGNSTFDGMFLF